MYIWYISVFILIDRVINYNSITSIINWLNAHPIYIYIYMLLKGRSQKHCFWERPKRAWSLLTIISINFMGFKFKRQLLSEYVVRVNISGFEEIPTQDDASKSWQARFSCGFKRGLAKGFYSNSLKP